MRDNNLDNYDENNNYWIIVSYINHTVKAKVFYNEPFERLTQRVTIHNSLNPFIAHFYFGPGLGLYLRIEAYRTTRRNAALRWRQETIIKTHNKHCSQSKTILITIIADIKTSSCEEEKEDLKWVWLWRWRWWHGLGRWRWGRLDLNT